MSLQQKGCLVKEHKSKYPAMICFDKQCKQSKILCMECLQFSLHNNHLLLQVDEILNNKHLDIVNWPPLKFDSKINYFQQDLTQYLQQILKQLDDYGKQLMEEIQKTKKEIKILIEQEQVEYKKNVTIYNNYTEEQLNLKGLKEKIENLKNNNNIQLEELNKYIKNFQTEVYNKLEKKEFLESSKIIQRNNNNNQNQNLKNLQIQLQQQQEKQEQFLKSVISSINLKQDITKFQPEKGQEENCKVLENNVYQGFYQKNSHYRSVKAFQKNEKVKIKFKFQEIQNQDHFYIGICDKNDPRNTFWYNSGNQIDLIDSNNYKSEFIYKTEKKLSNLECSKTVYLMEVDVEQNLLRISNEDQTCIAESQANLKDNLQEWQIVFGNHGNRTQFKIQFLK